MHKREYSRTLIALNGSHSLFLPYVDYTSSIKVHLFAFKHVCKKIGLVLICLSVLQ